MFWGGVMIIIKYNLKVWEVNIIYFLMKRRIWNEENVCYV